MAPVLSKLFDKDSLSEKEFSVGISKYSNDSKDRKNSKLTEVSAPDYFGAKMIYTQLNANQQHEIDWIISNKYLLDFYPPNYISQKYLDGTLTGYEINKLKTTEKIKRSPSPPEPCNYCGVYNCKCN